MALGSRLWQGFNAGDFRNSVLEESFDPLVEGVRTRGAAHARSEEAKPHEALVGDLDQLDVTPILLDGRSDQFEHIKNACFEIRCT